MEKAFVPDDEKHVVNFIFFVEVFYLKDIIVEKGVLNMTEKEKMEAGLWYDANNDQELIDQRLVCQDLCFELNQLKPSDEKRNEIIEKILGYFPENLVLLSPFTADYGKNIKLGKNVFVNINNYFMDGASIEIGDHVFIINFKFLYYAKVQNANQQATDDGLSDRNVTSDVHVRTANYSTRCSERPDR